MVAAATHSIGLRGPAFLVDHVKPAILQRTDTNFIGAVISEMGTDAGRVELRKTIAKERVSQTNTLRLFQPVQRTFHIVVVEAACLNLGNPRLDPDRIDSAGLVVRRVGDRGPEGWLRGESGHGGWVTLRDKTAQEAEPIAEKRVVRAQPHPLLMPVPGSTPEPMSEQVTRLFVAPPHVCKAAGRTLLYGVIPLSSSEMSDAPERVVFTPEEIADLAPAYLRAYNASTHPSVPYAGELVSAAHARVPGTTMAQFIEFLSHLKIVFDAFDGTDTVHADFRRALDQSIHLQFADGRSRNASDWLADAARVLVDGEEEEFLRRSPTQSGAARARYVEMPLQWPGLSAQQAQLFENHSLELTQHRLTEVVPQRTRYDNPEALYQVTAFVRVKRDEPCPPRLVWSQPSEPFTIAAWYDNGPVPPLQIQLPDLVPDKFRSLKPNVTFEVPNNLFNFLRRNSAKDILGGKAKKGKSGGLGWICGFNIPIITLCAFILLFIILYLLNFIFFWLPWVRICIPFPKK